MNGAALEQTASRPRRGPNEPAPRLASTNPAEDDDAYCIARAMHLPNAQRPPHRSAEDFGRARSAHISRGPHAEALTVDGRYTTMTATRAHLSPWPPLRSSMKLQQSLHNEVKISPTNSGPDVRVNGRFGTCIQYTTDLSAPNCGFLPKPANPCPGSGYTAFAGKNNAHHTLTVDGRYAVMTASKAHLAPWSSL